MLLTAVPVLARVTLAATMTAWLRSWRAGHVTLDEVLHHVEGAVGELGDHDHMVLGSAQASFGDSTTDGYAEPLALALRSFEGATADEIQLLLPTPGDTRGLPGCTATSPEPVKAFVTAAVEAGCVVLLTAPGDGTLTGLVVTPISGRMVAWHRFVLPAQPAATLASTRLPSWALSPQATMTPADADAALVAALHDVTSTLDQLELSAQRADRGEQLAALRRDGARGPRLPPGYSSRQRLRLARAGMVLGIAELAAADTDAGAVDAHQIVARAAALREITAAARAAYTATVNAPINEGFPLIDIYSSTEATGAC